MNLITKLLAILFFVSFISCKNYDQSGTAINGSNNFNDEWEFSKDGNSEVDSSFFSHKNKLSWEKVTIPHTAQLEPLVIKGDQWQGICYYRKFFKLDKNAEGKHIALKFDGAMQIAEVYLNGQKIKTNYGGYLPFYIDISDIALFDKENCIVVRLDNRDNPTVPPGKPIKLLDFSYYSGIYRNVWLIVKDKIHITDPFEVDKIAGGGVFITFPEVRTDSAKINVQIDVNNSGSENTDVYIETTVLDKDGKVISTAISNQVVNAKTSNVFKNKLHISSPKLWSPDFPYLYTLKLSVIKDKKQIGNEVHQFGIRSFNISAKDGLILNGTKIRLRGTNRHQEYPYIGNAISDNSNYRDAYKIKQAGFNFVRLSHYPHSESFLNACDELGILVMDAIPGWQFFGDSIFQENSISDVRKMIRRDRNHPSVIIWETSLNESQMTKDYMQKAHNAAHEEFPGINVYTSGWVDDVFDVFIPARQHAKPPSYWNNYTKEKPLLIAEYGDWEYYAQNAGFNQAAFKDLSEDERNSRQLRGFGQKRLLQQALNYQESYNDNLNGKSLGDANWLMFDYNRGYAPDIEASGIMDIFRLPKFAFYFYQSQANIIENQSNDFNKPMIYIANYYNDPSFPEIKIFSNCDEVELLLNGNSIEKRKPDTDRNSTNLVHPPFTFKLKDFIPGKLEAVGYIKGKEAVRTQQQTPGNASGIKLWIDESGKKLEKNCNDIVFLYAAIVDQKGTIIPEATNRVSFSIEGDAILVGNNPIEAEAGIASILIKAGKKGGKIKLSAASDGLKSTELLINIE